MFSTAVGEAHARTSDPGDTVSFLFGMALRQNKCIDHPEHQKVACEFPGAKYVPCKHEACFSEQMGTNIPSGEKIRITESPGMP
jgi:hypothetical protein